MVEIKSKKTGKILLIGEIIKETPAAVKLHTSSNWYKKNKIIVQYVIAIIYLSVVISCKPVSKTQANKLKKESENSYIIDQKIEENQLLDDQRFEY